MNILLLFSFLNFVHIFINIAVTFLEFLLLVTKIFMLKDEYVGIFSLRNKQNKKFCYARKRSLLLKLFIFFF